MQIPFDTFTCAFLCTCKTCIVCCERSYVFVADIFCCMFAVSSYDLLCSVEECGWYFFMQLLNRLGHICAVPKKTNSHVYTD